MDQKPQVTERTPLRILIVEDSEDAAVLIVEHLRVAGYDPTWERVECATAMTMALDRCSWDVVLCDHLMPDFNAFSAVTLLQKRRLDVPFIVVSGALGEELAIELMRAGAHDFVPKSNLARLIPVIRREVREAEARQDCHQAEDALHQSELLYRSTINAMDLAVHVTNPDFQIELVNRSLVNWCLAIGLPANNLVGRNLFEVFPFLSAKTREDYHQVIDTRQILVTEEENEFGGQVIYTETRKTPVLERGKVRRIVTLIRDTTRYKKSELLLRESEQKFRQLAMENAVLLDQARRDAETKAILLNEVNHRVKNNMAAIIGLLYLEQRHAESVPALRYPAMLEELVGRLQGLATAHRLLSVSNWSPLNLSDLASQIIRAVLVQAPKAKQVQFDVMPSTVQVNHTQANSLALILGELVTNTIKYALQDRDNAHITLGFNGDHEKVLLEYRDDGLGYPEPVLKSQQFSVGLYLIQSLVAKELQGNLELANDRGAVTRIRFARQIANDRLARPLVNS